MSDTQTGYFLTDALGSARHANFAPPSVLREWGETDDAGAIALVRDYSPYGETVQSLGSFETPYSYTGEMTDASGLVYLRARYYDPATGRFVSRDTWEGEYDQPGTENRFAYVNNDPISHSDPSGHMEICEGVYKSPCSGPLLQDWKRTPIPDPNADQPTRIPAGIIWSPSVSIGTLRFTYPNGDPVPPGTTGSQYWVKDNNGRYLYGACGPLSIAAIAQRDPQSLITYLSSRNLGSEYLGAGGLVSIIQMLSGWDADSITGISDQNASLMLRMTLSKGHFPIPGVLIAKSNGFVKTEGVGHWLVVTGLSVDYQWKIGKNWQWVRVFNPFNNQNEYYMWSLFIRSWSSNGNWATRTMVTMFRKNLLSSKQ